MTNSEKGPTMMTTDDRDQAVNADEFNGWTNRETWAASLHLSNDFGLYEMVNGWANDARRKAIEASERDVFDHFANGVTTVEVRTVTELADLLESYFDDTAADMAEESRDISYTERVMVLEVGSRWRVNWRELAENWLEGFEFEDDDR